MMLTKITEKFGELVICEKRISTQEYCELVFLSKETEKWHSIFTETLGPAVKPPGKIPNREHRLLTKDYGGIWFNQTLFKKDFEDAIIIAMFWPWRDNIHTTLKLIRVEKKAS